MESITFLPKCERCKGAFYPDPTVNVHWYTARLCEDCMEVGTDELVARDLAAFRGEEYAPICFSPRFYAEVK